MICKKAFETDLAAFLLDPGADQWTQFRAHYPQCPQCSAEVWAWTELDTLLRSGEGERAEAPGAATVHPPEERLLMFEQHPGSMPATERQSIERHLSTCRSCADELRTLRRFDLAHWERPMPAPTLRERFAALGLGTFARRLIVHPAFAYALVLLLLYPTVRGYFPTPSPPQNEELSQPLGATRPELEKEGTTVYSAQARKEEFIAESTRGDGQALLRPSSRPLAAVTPAPQPGWLVVTLEADRSIEVAATSFEEGIVIRIPAVHLSATEVEVVVRAQTRQREVRERFVTSDGRAEMRLPASWVRRGVYRIEVHPAEGGVVGDEVVATFFLRVR